MTQTALLTTALALVCCLLLLAGCRPDEDTWEQIAASGVLRIGVDPTYPPFALADGTEVQGLDIDLARALAAELGLQPQFTYFGYDGLYDALITRQVDVLISALVIMPERTRDIAYSDAYFDAGQVLIVPANAPFQELSELDGKTLAVELGALGHVEAQQLQRRLPDLIVQTHGSIDEALDAVAQGEADAALVDSVGGRLFLRDHPDSGLIRRPQAIASEPYALAVRIEDQTLLRHLNQGLRRLDETGELETFISRWLGS